VVCFFIYQIRRKFNFRFLKILESIILSPIYFLGVFIPVSITIVTSQMAIYLYLIFSFTIPMLIFNLDCEYQITNLKFETWIYIICTCGVGFSFIFHKQIRFLVYKVIPLIDKIDGGAKKTKLIELNNYILSENNIRFMIYFLYFLGLIVINFMSLQGTSYYKDINIDKAVLQSFVTFIAFDRVVANLKANEFRPSNLLDIMKDSIGSFYNEKN
ncbi:MAG: hypothetical protein KYX68_13905, partial [Flavobacterium sp.]|nr:hypothetical protein [Flavobacterium sp.]